MLVACSDAQIPLLDGVEAQVDVSGDVVAADFLLVVRGDAVGDLRTRIGALSGAGMADGEHVAAVNVRGFGAGARLVAVTSMLETEGDIQWLGQADVVAVLQVEVAGPLIGDVDAGGEFVRRVFPQRRVLVVVGALLGVVASVGAAQVPGPTADADIVAPGAKG
ncbi:hypothetical protein D3C86_1478030 [compost metagenome]